MSPKQTKRTSAHLAPPAPEAKWDVAGAACAVVPVRLVGEVIAFAEIVRRRRRRLAREQHAACVEILRRSVETARGELRTGPTAERWIRAVRLRKLEDLHAYAVMLA
jgi:hypothetical protein